MARLLNAFEPDTSWGSSLVNIFMDWSSPGSPPPPSNSKSKVHQRSNDDDVCISLAGLSVTNNHPYAPLELPSLVPVRPQTPLLYSSTLPTSRTECLASTPVRYRTISPPLQSSPAVERADFLNASDAAPSQRLAQRFNRHRPRPNRPRPRPVYRPLDEAETADLPPVYSATDPLVPKPHVPLQELEVLTWRDGFRLPWRGLQSSRWSIKTWRDKNRQMRRVNTRSRNMPQSIHAAKGATSRGVGRACRKVKAMPNTAIGSYKRLQIKRAKNKLQWLRKNGFLSDQERMLTRDLRG